MNNKKFSYGLLFVMLAVAFVGLVVWQFGGHFGQAVAGGLLCAAAPVALTDEQIKEFKTALDGLKEYASLFPGLKDLFGGQGGFESIKSLPKTVKDLVEENTRLKGDVTKMQKRIIGGNAGTGVRWVGAQPFVTEDCAKAFASLYVMQCAQRGAWPMAMRDEAVQQRLLAQSAECLGLEVKAALTTTEIPVPTVYVPQVVELVWKYGQIRQFGTTFPLGAGTVKLPRLKAGEDAFAFLGVGTAGMSQTVPEKKVTAELVTFTANKFGGIVRIPTELEEDTFIPVGQFLARYISRRLAFGEDDTAFNGDGTATYANISGIKQYAITNTAYLQQLAAGKTKPSDATLADFRNMRAKVNSAAYANGAYYMHPTMDALLVTFNTSATVMPYRRNPDGSATLDGFPIRWTGVHAAYSTAANAIGHLASFGDLSYVYLGERGQPRVETSRDVFFATDEIAMRALERIDVEIVAIDAMSALLTAAS